MTEPRDDSFDRLLRQTLRQPSDAGATPLCLDAETMAAWLDGGLSGTALATAEAHASTCPRCRALVAVMARSETADERPVQAVEVSAFEPEGEPAGNWWPWLVPLTAAALIAMAIWIPRRAPQPAQESTIALAPPSETAAPASPSGRIDERQQTPPPEQNAQAAAAKDAPSDKAEIAKRDQAELKRESASAAAPPRTPSALPASPRSPTAQFAPVEVPVVPPPSSAPAPAVTGLAEPVVAPAPAPGAPRASLRAAQETVIVAEFQSPSPSTSSPPVGAAAARGGTGVGRGTGPAAAGGGGGGGGRGGRAEPTFRTGVAPPADGIAPPNASQPTRWRVLASGIVERSTPPGAPWELVAIGPPGTRVTNGGAPSPLVCWLVGRSGVVFLTIDGRSFARIPFPETVDLAFVRATSAREATVTTTDGRTFVTTDGGQTWSRTQ